MNAEDLTDDDFSRIEMSMSAETHAVGYYETELNFDYDVGRCSVWVPIPKSEVPKRARVGCYTYTVHWSKKMTSLTQGWVCMPCLGSFEVQLPAGADVVSVDEGEAATLSRPAGAVLMAHGLSGPRFEFAHVAEALAARGFVVMVPEMDDSGCNTRQPILAHGSQLLGTHTVLRMHLLAVCARYLRERHGDGLRLGLMGYSIGNASVRHFRCDDWPKVHIAGPAPTGQTAPVSPFRDRSNQLPASSTDHPCLLLLSHADPLSAPPDEAACLAGHPQPAPLTFEHCTSARLPKATMHVFTTLSHAGFTHPDLVAADQTIMRRCSCLLACPSPVELTVARRAARLIVPLIVRFFEQTLAPPTTLLGSLGLARAVSSGAASFEL